MRPTKCSVDAWHYPCVLNVAQAGEVAASRSLVPDCRQFLAVGHQRSTFPCVGAVEPEDLVVGAADQRMLGFLVGLVVLPDADLFEPDDRGLVVLRQRHLDAAAI